MGFRPKNTLLSIIQGLGLTSGLKLCLDAGDAASYTSGQKWLDTSGGGYDFFRGSTGSAGADDPTFNGTPGNLTPSEYWSFDGGDFFRYDSANETWMQNIHKDNAKYTMVAYIYAVTGVNNIVMGSNGGTSGNGVGFHFGTPSTNNVTIRIANGLGLGSSMDRNSTALVTNGAWNFIAATVDEGVSGFFQCNATQETMAVAPSYSSPSAGNATYTVEVGARGNGNSPMPNGSRMAMVAVWEGVTLTQAQVNDIYKGVITAKAEAVGTNVTTGIGSSRGDLVGSAVGLGVATGVGISRADAVGSITGLGVALGNGSAVSRAAGAAVGAGVALGNGSAVLSGVGSATGLGVASGVLRATTAAIGLATGLGVASGVLRATTAAIGLATGLGVASGVLRATKAAVAFSSGIGAAAAVGISTAASKAESFGVGVVSGVGTTVYNSVGNSYGQGQANGISYAFYLDPEVVCIANEPRVAYVKGNAVEDLIAVVPAENRDAFVPSENRVSVVPWERRESDTTSRGQTADTLNRQRKC